MLTRPAVYAADKNDALHFNGKNLCLLIHGWMNISSHNDTHKMSLDYIALGNRLTATQLEKE